MARQIPMFPIPLSEQISEVERELEMRHAVYARRVKAGAITQNYADARIAVMEAVLETLKRRQHEAGKHEI